MKSVLASLDAQIKPMKDGLYKHFSHNNAIIAAMKKKMPSYWW